MRSSLKFTVSFLIVVCAMLTGRLFQADTTSAWYYNLKQPCWLPPAFVFPIVWSILYLLLVIGLWMFWNKKTRLNKTRGFLFFSIQMILNFSWMPVFFGLHQIGLGMLIIAGIFFALIGMIVEFYKVHKWSGLLQIPYLIWTCFAFSINTYLYLYN